MARARAERPAAMRNRPHSMLLEQAREQVQGGSERTRAQDPASAAPAGAGAAAEPAVAQTARAPRVSPAAARRSQQLASAERLRQMGVIGDPSDGALDLDAVLRQRRSAG